MGGRAAKNSMGRPTIPLLDTAGVQLRLILEIESTDAPKRFVMAGVATALVGTFGAWSLPAIAAVIVLAFEVGLYACVRALPPKKRHRRVPWS